MEPENVFRDAVSSQSVVHAGNAILGIRNSGSEGFFPTILRFNLAGGVVQPVDANEESMR